MDILTIKCKRCEAMTNVGAGIVVNGDWLCNPCGEKVLTAPVGDVSLGAQLRTAPGTFRWMEEHARRIRDAKGKEYTVGSDNRLENFDVAAAQLATTPEIVLAIFAAKHWASILTYCRKPEEKLSEPIEDRIADMINYLMLLYLMVHRRNGDGQQATTRPGLDR